jgi:aryl-alcohol dehydrogenase-like predicted oxidoreductase
MRASDRVPLGDTGLEVTRMGMGTGPLGMVHDDATWSALLDAAWDAGIRAFDTAPYYGFGNSERRLGRLLAGRPRDDFVLSTKVGRLLRADGPIDPFAEAFYYPEGMPADVPRTVYDYSGAATAQSLEESLQRLGLERVDVVHIHDIVELASGVSHVDEAISQSFPVLAALREQGAIAAVGAGAQVNQVLVDLAAACDFDCFLVAGRYTLLDQSAIDEVLPLCLDKRIAVIIGSPYNTGILHDPGPDATFDFTPAPAHLIERARQLQAVCERHGVPLPAAAIQFPFGHPAVAQVLTGARSAAELNENVRLMEVEVPEALWHELRDTGLLHPRAPLPCDRDQEVIGG